MSGYIEESNFFFDIVGPKSLSYVSTAPGRGAETNRAVINPTAPVKWSNSYFLNNSNRSSPDKESRVNDPSTSFMSDVIFYTYYYGFLFALSVINLIGNGLIIYCVTRQKRLRVPANYFIVSLACSDLFLGIVYPIYNVSHMRSAAIERTIGVWESCTVIITLTLGMLNVSSYNLVGVTVMRFISIKDPLKFPRIVTHTRAISAVVVLWILLMALACGLYLEYPQPVDYESCRYETVLKNQPMHIFFTCIFSMILPLFVMIVLYIYMSLIARKQARAIFTQGSCPVSTNKRSSTDTLNSRMLRQELKMFRVAGSLLGYFTLAWAPFVIFEFVSIVNANQDINRYIRATVRIILHSNSAVNAFIYAGRLKEFRDAIKRQTSCCGRDQKTSRPSQHSISDGQVGIVRNGSSLSRCQSATGRTNRANSTVLSGSGHKYIKENKIGCKANDRPENDHLGDSETATGLKIETKGTTESTFAVMEKETVLTS